MNYEEALSKAIEQGAIRVFRLSDNMAFVYRLKNGGYQARGLYAEDGNWSLGNRLVSARDIQSPDGWYDVPALPGQAKAIGGEEAKQNPGYEMAILQQCYTCKERKPAKEFERQDPSGRIYRNWECNTCYERRMRELSAYRQKASPRQGDRLDKETLASPPPPEGQI